MLILGSKSPRRKEILNFFSIPFKVENPDFNESSITFKGDPISYVLDIARGKALSIKCALSDILLTADTTIHFNNSVMNKPKNEEDALQMLSSLSGSVHEVYTGLCGYREGNIFTEYEMTKVHFTKASLSEIKKYYQAIDTKDKAGSYAIQQTGSIIVEKIEGCPYNVMGLPVHALKRLLSKLGIDLWDYLKT